MNAKTSAKEAFLGPDLHLRPLRWSDADAVAQIIHAACEAEGDVIAAMTAEELKHGWQDPQFNLETDGFVVETSEGRVAGYADITNSFGHAILNMNGNVHPDFKGRGIGTTLLRTVETRAREIILLAEPDVRAAIQTTIGRNAPEDIELHGNEGYRPIQYHWRMEIVLNGPPAKRNLPDGIELRPFIKEEHDVKVWQADTEAFRDHPGSHEWSLEEWRRYRFADPEFDPSLWMIAWDGDQVAGYSLNRHRMGIGWIRTLGVRRAWRKRGLAETLLLHSFGEYHRRGMKTIGLGVNAANPTGATRLYQRVGMHPASEHVTYEKELRPGHEPEDKE